MKIAMPSPNGTNRAGLYVQGAAARAVNPRAAYDSAAVLNALRAKFKNPREVMRKLGLDEKLLDKQGGDQAVPVEALVALIKGLLDDNAKLKQRMATDAVLAASSPTTATTAPHDDIAPKLTDLRSILAAFMPPTEFEKAQQIIAEVIESVGALQREAWAARNKDTLTGDDETDQPPTFAGKPARAGGLAADGFNARYPNAARIGTDGTLRDTDGARKRMLANMSRIQNLG